MIFKQFPEFLYHVVFDAAPVVRGQSVRVDTCPGSFVRGNSCPGEHLSGGNICPPVCLRLGMVTTCLPRLWACWVWALNRPRYRILGQYQALVCKQADVPAWTPACSLSWSCPGVSILPHSPINFLETNKQFDKSWKGIRRIRHLWTVWRKFRKILKILSGKSAIKMLSNYWHP